MIREDGISAKSLWLGGNAVLGLSSLYLVQLAIGAAMSVPGSSPTWVLLLLGALLVWTFVWGFFFLARWLRYLWMR